MGWVLEAAERARRGRLTFSDWFKAWIISMRLFAAVWIALAYIAGLAWYRWRTGLPVDARLAAAGLMAVEGILLLAHFWNNFRDYERGVDRGLSPEEVSRAKPYTAAALLVPLGITPVWFQRLWAAFFAVWAGVFTGVAAARLDWGWQLWPLLAWGYIGAITYTELAKPRGLGELWVFLKVETTFLAAWMFQRPFSPEPLLAAVPLAFAGAFFYSIDQYQDAATDFTKKIRNFAILLWRSGLPLGVYILFGYTFYVVLAHAAVTLALAPPAYLAYALAVWPVMLYAATLYHVDRERALKLSVFTFIYLVPLQLILACL